MADRVTIQFGDTSRRLDFPFAICGSAEDLRLIARTILDSVGMDSGDEGFRYGWVAIHLTFEAPRGKPLEWSEERTR